jgi:predicted glycosyltransferase
MIREITRVVEPAALIVDHLPFGLYRELLMTLESVPTRKYLLTRGIIDSADAEVRELLASGAVAAHYDRILIAADKRVIASVGDPPLSMEARAKCEWIGYITRRLADHGKSRRTHAGSLRVVCSAGSGLRGEAMFLECLRAAPLYPSVSFDVVLGPRCTLTAPAIGSLPSNVQLSTMRVDLPDLHAMADIVITSGGYNSLLEAIGGGARVIVSPVNTGMRDEQLRHAKALQHYYPLKVADNLANLAPLLSEAIAAADAPSMPYVALDLDGLARARDLIFEDLGVEQCRDLAQAISQPVRFA